MEIDEQQAIEWLILIGLHKATVEQQSMLIGVEKQRSKLLFNTWNKQGVSMLKKFEGLFSPEALEELSEAIEEATNKLRQSLEIIKD